MGAEVVTDYGYDEINRLTREATCDFMNQYYYDDGGNRTKLVHKNAVYSKDGNGRIVSMLTKASQSTQGLTKTYLYANFTELTKMTASEYGGTTRDYTYEHDNAGRLTRQVQNVFSPNSTTTYNYEWDALDRMTKVQRVASGVTKTINYTYNAAGLRVRRVDTSTSVTKLWTYQGNNIASVSTKSGGSFGDMSTQEWVYTVAPGLINNVLERHKANYASATTTSEYYQYDHRGNVAAVTDYSGKILRGYQYDAFGNIPFSFATGQSGAAPTDDILFTGKDLDPDTALYYFNARWYDPEGGQFLVRASAPPHAEHTYSLADGNPIAFYDPSGQDKKQDETAAFVKCAHEIGPTIRSAGWFPPQGCAHFADVACKNINTCMIKILGRPLECCHTEANEYMALLLISGIPYILWKLGWAEKRSTVHYKCELRCGPNNDLAASVDSNAILMKLHSAPSYYPNPGSGYSWPETPPGTPLGPAPRVQ